MEKKTKQWISAGILLVVFGALIICAISTYRTRVITTSEGSLDVVMSTSVIEHLRYPAKFFEEAFEWLKAVEVFLFTYWPTRLFCKFLKFVIDKGPHGKTNFPTGWIAIGKKPGNSEAFIYRKKEEFLRLSRLLWDFFMPLFGRFFHSCVFDSRLYWRNPWLPCN